MTVFYLSFFSSFSLHFSTWITTKCRTFREDFSPLSLMFFFHFLKWIFQIHQYFFFYSRVCSHETFLLPFTFCNFLMAFRMHGQFCNHGYFSPFFLRARKYSMSRDVRYINRRLSIPFPVASIFPLNAKVARFPKSFSL